MSSYITIYEQILHNTVESALLVNPLTKIITFVVRDEYSFNLTRDNSGSIWFVTITNLQTNEVDHGYYDYSLGPAYGLSVVTPLNGNGHNDNPLSLILGSNTGEALLYNDTTNQWEVSDLNSGLYTPSNNADWDSIPSNIGQALDELASRIKLLE